MFADDINLFISDSNIENLFETMNEELRKVATRFKTSKLSLNISKTKYSLFHSRGMTVYEMNIFQILCFMYLCKNGNTPSIFKHIYTLKPINKYTTRSKNILFKPLCKKNFAKFKLSYRGPHLWNKFIAPNNDLLEAVTIHIFKIRLKKIIFASTNILEDF